MALELKRRQDAAPTSINEPYVPFRLDRMYTYGGRDFGKDAGSVPRNLAKKAIYDQAVQKLRAQHAAETAEAIREDRTPPAPLQPGDIPTYREVWGNKTDAEVNKIIEDAISEQGGTWKAPADPAQAEQQADIARAMQAAPQAPAAAPSAPAAPESGETAGAQQGGSETGENGDGGTAPTPAPESGPIPADFPHAAKLKKAGVTTFEALRTKASHEDLDGIGPERWADVQAGLRGEQPEG